MFKLLSSIITLEFEDKILEMRQSSSNSDFEILKMVDTVKNSFKKSGVWSSKKLVKYVPQRLKEVTIIVINSAVN